jgi:hypothetical protein
MRRCGDTTDVRVHSGCHAAGRRTVALMPDYVILTNFNDMHSRLAVVALLVQSDHQVAASRAGHGCQRRAMAEGGTRPPSVIVCHCEAPRGPACSAHHRCTKTSNTTLTGISRVNHEHRLCS